MLQQHRGRDGADDPGTESFEESAAIKLLIESTIDITNPFQIE